MENNNRKAWLYLLPAGIFLAVFMIYPLIDVFIYSIEEGFNFASQTSQGTGLFNFSYILHDPYFLQAVRNTALCVVITVPISTGLSLLIAFGLSSIKPLRNLFQTVYISDIIERHTIRHPEELEELVNILASAVGSLTSPLKLANTFKSVKNKNIGDHCCLASS